MASRKRPAASEDETVAATGRDDVLANKFTDSAPAPSSRLQTFLQKDTASAEEKEKEVKAMYIQGLSHSSVSKLSFIFSIYPFVLRRQKWRPFAYSVHFGLSIRILQTLIQSAVNGLPHRAD